MNNRKIFIISMFVMSLLFIIIYNASKDRNDFIDFLDKTNKNTEVYVNYEKVNNPQKIIESLKNIKKIYSLKSSPYDGGYWKVKIENSQSKIILGIKKGSYYKNEYWIYKKILDPHYSQPFYKELGIVKTNIFDKYIEE